jgi:hypothetical protein
MRIIYRIVERSSNKATNTLVEAATKSKMTSDEPFKETPLFCTGT